MTESKAVSEAKRKQHIQEMLEQLRKYGGGPESTYLGGLNLEGQEQFLERVLSFEEAEERPLIDFLEQDGVRMLPPEELEDSRLHEKLWEVIHAMARMRCYLSSTDHLSDRELYGLLWSDILREPTTICTDSATSCHIDILGGCSDEDIKTRLIYYADEYERLDWEDAFPDEEIPPKKPLPFDRDRHLPAPAHGAFKL